MLIQSQDYVEYCRDTALHVRDLHDLALRGSGKEQITRTVCEGITREVDLRAEDKLVDIGCGDGTLLRMAIELGVRDLIGVQATEEEAQLLRNLGLPVRQGLTHDLPIESASASVVVCNSVLLVVPRPRIMDSLKEMSRIAKPGARVYLGEIPFVPGPEPYPRFTTISKALSYFYRKHGVRASLGILRGAAARRCKRQPLILHDCSLVSFYSHPAEFIAQAQSAGLELVRYWQHAYPETRYNYLFRKPA
jgi:SAM-dependent methyltransferase